jgi:hypothetical protein
MPAFALDSAHVYGCTKVMRGELAQSTLQALAKHQHANFHFSFTGDETWMFSAHDHQTMWVASWDDVEEIGRRYVSSRRLWSQSFPMELVSARSRFFHKDTK